MVKCLEDNTAEFALISVVPEHLEVEEEILLPNKLFMVSSSEHAMSEQLFSDTIQLNQVPIIYREKGSGTRILLEQHMDRLQVKPKVKLELTSTEAVKQAVIAGLGVSVLSIFSMRYELAEKAVQIVPFKGFPLSSHWRLVWLKKKRLSPVGQAYLDYIREEKSLINEKQFSWANDY